MQRLSHCHLGPWQALPAHGQAQEHLVTATTMYREMGMTYWLEQAEADLQALC